MSAAKFSATVVTYHSNPELLARTLASLSEAVIEGRGARLISEAMLYIVDNGPPESIAAVREAMRSYGANAGRVEIVHGHGNIGYGRANNLVLPRLDSDFHLIMNPDVELASDALKAALETMRDDPQIGMIAPAARGASGERQYLCKRYPSVWVLFLRGFAPKSMRGLFAKSLDEYEMRDIAPDKSFPVALASGCFMLVRTAQFSRIRGFDPRFFMYFEDYDLSLRIGRDAKVAYLPQAQIVHHGGEASHKGWRHVLWFLRSAWRFFATHGWKIT